MKNQAQKKGISLIALIITIIVIVLLAAIVVNSSITTPQSANFAKFASDMGELQQAVTLTYFDIYSVEAVKSSPKTDAEIYQDIAKGNGESILAVDVPSTLGTRVAWKVNDAAKLNGVEALPNYGDLYLTNNGIIYLASGFPYQGTTYLTASIKLNGSLSTSSNTIENSLGENLKNYTIYGNSIQNGTPTPTSPVAIQSLGDNGTITVKRCGKNINSTSNIVLNNRIMTKKIIKVNPHTQYTISVNEYITEPKWGICGWTEYIENPTPSQIWTEGTIIAGNTNTFNSGDYQYITFRVWAENDSYGVNENTKVQLEQGSTATAYEPYQEQTYTINLGDHEPLRAIGDVADYIDYENGRIVRNIGYTKMLSSYITSISGAIATSTKVALVSITSPFGLAATGINTLTGYCNIGKVGYAHSLKDTGVVYWGYNTNPTTFFGVPTSMLNATDLQGVKDFADSNDIYIQYVLATPYEEEGTITMPLISTVEGQNTITVSDGTVSASKVDVTCYQH